MGGAKMKDKIIHITLALVYVVGNVCINLYQSWRKLGS